MRGLRITTLGRFAALFPVAVAIACDGGTKPDPEPNRPPVAIGSIPPITLTEGDSYTVDASQFFSDPDGDQLGYSATSSDNSVLTVSVSGSNVTAAAVAAGTVVVTVTATDPDGLSASHSVGVNVESANRAPVATDAIPSQDLTEGDTTTIDASGHFTDPDGDALTYSAASGDADVATAAVSGSVVTIVAVAEGTATVTVTATDPDGASAMQEVTVTVEAANRAPVAVGEIPPLTLDEGEEFTSPIDQFFSDPDDDMLTYTAAVSDTSVATASISGTMITVIAVGEGMATITITATDPEGLSATQTAGITVVSVNEGPTLTDTIPHQELTVGDTVTLDVSNNFTDPDGDTLTFTVETDDDGVAAVSVDGSMVTVAAVGPGSTFITVTATDPGGASAAQTFEARVAQGNRAPQAVGEIPDGALSEGEVFMTPVDGFFTDPDGDALTYSAESSDAEVATASMAANVITVTAVAEGMAMITVTATDPDGLSATQTMTLTVFSVNQGPTLTDTIPHQDMMPGDTITLDLADHFTDPDGDTLAFTAETDDATVATVSIDGSMVTVAAVDVGTAFITVAATDPDGLSAAQTFAAFVAQGNRAPRAVGKIAGQTVTAGDSVTVDVSGNFSDPDDDALTYTASSSDEDAGTVSVSGAVVTVMGVAAGSATVTVTATDPGGLSAMQTFDVTVNAANRAPEISDTIPVHDLLLVLDSADMTMVDTMTSVVLDLTAYFSDPDDDELTYTASVADDAVAKVESVEGSVLTTVAVSSDTTFAHDTTMLTVTATDPGGLSVSQEVAVLVANSDYRLWDLIVIQDAGTVQLGGFLTLGTCIDVTNFPFSGTVYTVHWTTWQVKKGTGWVNLPGTYRAEGICPHLDLPDAPAGTYRVVGELTTYPFGGDPETESVLDRRKSTDYVKESN